MDIMTASMFKILFHISITIMEHILGLYTRLNIPTETAIILHTNISLAKEAIAVLDKVK